MHPARCRLARAVQNLGKIFEPAPTISWRSVWRAHPQEVVSCIVQEGLFLNIATMQPLRVMHTSAVAAPRRLPLLVAPGAARQVNGTAGPASDPIPLPTMHQRSLCALKWTHNTTSSAAWWREACLQPSGDPCCLLTAGHPRPGIRQREQQRGSCQGRAAEGPGGGQGGLCAGAERVGQLPDAR